MLARTGRFPRADRILKTRDYRRIGREGRRLGSEYFVLLVAGSREGGRSRLGVTVSRRVGNAVVRNRVKRGVREWFRQNREHFESLSDVVVIARPRAASLQSIDLIEDLNRTAFPGQGVVQK